MTTTVGEGMTVGEKLVQIDTKLDTVITQQGREIGENKKEIAAVKESVTVLQLQSNTHEVKVSQLWERSLGTFSRSMIWVSTAIGLFGIALRMMGI